MKKLLFIAVFFSAVAPKLLSISTGFFQLSIFRFTIIFSLVAFIIYSSIKANKIKVYTAENRYSIIFMSIWLIYSVFSVLWIQDLGLWIRGVYFVGIGVTCIYLFQAIFQEKKDILISFFLLGVMSIIHNLIGWYEIMTGKYHFSNEDYAERYNRYQVPVSTFGNVNDYSLFMLFSIFILYICYKNANSLIISLIFKIAMLSCVLIIFAASSRGVIIGLTMASIWFGFNIFKNSKGRFLAVTSIITLVSLITISSNLRSFILSLLGLENQEINVTEETGRLNLLKNGIYFLYRTFGFGTGSGNIEYWMLNENIYPVGVLLNIHNWWAEILVGYGIVIFILYLIFYVKLFKSMYKSYTRSSNTLDRSISLAIMCCLIGYVVGGISSSSNIDSEWLWVFWAIAIAYQGMIKQKQVKINPGY